MKKFAVFALFTGLGLAAQAQDFYLTLNYTTNPLFNGSSAYAQLSYSVPLSGVEGVYVGAFSKLSSNLSSRPFDSGFTLTLNPNITYSLPSYSQGALSLYPYLYLELTTNLLPSFSFNPFLAPGIPFSYSLGDGYSLGGSVYGDLYFLPSWAFYLSSFAEARYTPPTLNSLTVKLGADQYYLPSFTWDAYLSGSYVLDPNNTLTLWLGYGPSFSAYVQNLIRF